MSSKKSNTAYYVCVCVSSQNHSKFFLCWFVDYFGVMEPLPKMSSVPKPARKSLEPSPAPWTRNLPQIYSEYWCKLGDSSRSHCDCCCDRFSAAIRCIAVAAASGASCSPRVIIILPRDKGPGTLEARKIHGVNSIHSLNHHLDGSDTNG